MKLLHICLFYRNPMFRGLIYNQLEQKINLRVFYYETRAIGLKAFTDEYVDSMPSNIWYLPSPFLRRVRLKIVSQKMLKLYENNHNFDLMHAHTLCQDGLLAYYAYKKWNIPYVLTVRVCDLTKDNLWQLRSTKKLMMKVIESAQMISFLSSRSRERLLKEYIDNSKIQKTILDKSMIIPNGVNSFWHEQRLTKAKGYVKNELNIITVGRVEKNKNQAIVAKVAKLIAEQGYKVTYTIVGKVVDQKYKKKIIEEFNCRFIDFCEKEQLMNYYKEQDLFVMLSHHETFGLTYVEAMTQGLPLVYTAGQGFDGQFDNGVVGYAASDIDVEDIISAIKKCLDNYTDISKRCVSLSSQFEWSEIAENYRELYERGMNS